MIVELKLRLRKDAILLHEAFDLDEERAREIDALLQNLIRKHDNKSEMLEEIWNSDSLSFPEKVLATFMLGFNLGYMKAKHGTALAVIFLGGVSSGEVAG
ncbi:MAG: hypothetical protein DRJ67_01390 [Thermoprotei archaeon]|nr:MAG: hypothetical protein DRJ67_01390 [Thermoprotei archaeon]